VVYAIYFSEVVDYFVFEENFLSIPFSVNDKHVDVVDSRLSKFWTFGSYPTTDSGIQKNYKVISFMEWASNDYFYEGIVNGNKNAEIWRNYRIKMDLEYASSTLTTTATRLSHDWFQCVNCMDAWQSNSQYEVLQCPHCGANQLKPN
jgi:hypothetical protein